METSTNLKFILNRPEESGGDDQPSGGGNNDQSGGGGNNNSGDGTNQNTGGNTNNNTNGGTNGNTNNSTNGTSGTSGGSGYYSNGQVSYTTDDSTVAVPNTGENTSTNSSARFTPILIGLFFIILAIVVARLAIKRKKSHIKFSDDDSQLNLNPIRISIASIAVLAVAFLGVSIFNRVYIESEGSAEAASSLSISSLGALEAKVASYDKDEATIYTVKDNIKVSVSGGIGFRATIQAEDNKLYLNGDKTSSSYFTPVTTSGDNDTGNLNKQENSWGYSLDNASWAPVPTTAETIFGASPSTTPGSGSAVPGSFETDVYFGINPSKSTKNGTYSAKITYTVVAIEPTPEPEPALPECSATVHPTANSSCKMADGKEWKFGSSGNDISWSDAFTGATGQDGHDATLRDNNICPTGYVAPTIADFDVLVQAYGGTPYSTTTHLRDGYKEDTGALFKVLGLGGSYWSSTENTDTNAFVLFVSDSRSYTIGVSTKTEPSAKILCYKSDAEPEPLPMQTSSAADLPEGATSSVKDTRDGQVYTVYRWPSTGTAGTDYPTGLAGAVIMTKDLSIGYATGNTIIKGEDLALTTADSAAAATITARASAGDWSTVNDSSNQQYINGTGGNYDNHSYYSFGAAQAVCPKGWRPPTNSEYSSIVSFMGGNNSTGSSKITNTPYNFVFGGNFSSSDWASVGSEGTYWSSSASSSSNGYALSFDASHLDVVFPRKHLGASVRCITSADPSFNPEPDIVWDLTGDNDDPGNGTGTTLPTTGP